MGRWMIVVTAAVALLCGCQKSTDEDPEEEPEYRTEFKWDTPTDIFGFQPEERYAYCPSVVELADGSCHMFFCGNPVEGEMVDHIYHMTISADGTKSTPESVLQPTSGAWDSFHCCDPCVIEGKFKLDSKSYKYAMFYLGIDKGDCLGNEIGVAFSNDLGATSWTKYPRQLVAFDGDRTAYWGVGQPSAVSLDKKGKVLLTYTVGDETSTRVVFSEADLSDMSSPEISKPKTVVSMDGIVMHNCDFAVDAENNRIVATVAANWPSSYPTYIESYTAVGSMDFDAFRQATGKWERLDNIGSSVSGFNRNHNACVMRDSFGYIDDYHTPTVFYTVAGTTPVAEWSYHIYRTDGILEKIPIID